jgi:hypothetical protein
MHSRRNYPAHHYLISYGDRNCDRNHPKQVELHLIHDPYWRMLINVLSPGDDFSRFLFQGQTDDTSDMTEGKLRALAFDFLIAK